MKFFTTAVYLTTFAAMFLTCGLVSAQDAVKPAQVQVQTVQKKAVPVQKVVQSPVQASIQKGGAHEDKRRWSLSRRYERVASRRGVRARAPLGGRLGGGILCLAGRCDRG